MEKSTNKFISFSEEEKNHFYDQFGSSHFKLQTQVAREYAKHKIDIYFKSIGFAATVVSTIGIIAGFGFTALTSVESKALFFVGEGLLIYAILDGLIWIQSIYNSEFESLELAGRNHEEYFFKRNGSFYSVWDDISKTGSVEENKFRDFMNLNVGTRLLFAPAEPKLMGSLERNKKLVFSGKLFYLMIFGSFLLLSSFFVCSLLNLLLRLFR